MSDTIHTRVTRGAEFLDRVKPGWERLVDLAALDLSDGCRCVLGHVFAGEAGVFNLFMAGGEYWWDGYSLGSTLLPDLMFPSALLGFNSDKSAEFPALDEAWISLLKSRFDSGSLSDCEQQ